MTKWQPTNLYHHSGDIVVEYEMDSRKLIVRTHDAKTLAVYIEVELPEGVHVCEGDEDE